MSFLSEEPGVDLKPIPKHSGYFATTAGEIYSEISDRILKGSVDHYGYRNVNLKGSRPRRVHRLVAYAFYGIQDGVVRHLDGDKLNNKPENLAWGTQRENILDKKRHGTWQAGDNAAHRILNSGKVRKIRNLHASGNYTLSELGNMFNVTKYCIWRIVHRKTWKNVS